VRVDRHRVGVGHRFEIRRRPGDDHRGRAVRAVDVEPESFVAADVADLAQRVYCARADCAGRADNEEGAMSRGAVLGDAAPEGGDVHAAVGLNGNPPELSRAEP